MVELLVLILFCWIFFGAVKLMFKIAWGVAKILAVVLLVLSFPALIGCLLYAGGVILLLPVLLIAGAWGLLKACI